MKHLVYFSRNAVTTGNFDLGNLMKAGRMDIVCNVVISAFFISHDVREDVKVHLIFYGMPDPPKHIEIEIKEGLDISKKNVAGLIKKVLYKYKEGEKKEVFPGVFVEKKSLLKVVDELVDEGKEIFILDKKGEDIREIKFEYEKEEEAEPVFIFGDQDGIPRKELKRLKQSARSVSVSPKMLFASQVVTIVNNELDRRNL